MLSLPAATTINYVTTVHLACMGWEIATSTEPGGWILIFYADYDDNCTHRISTKICNDTSRNSFEESRGPEIEYKGSRETKSDPISLVVTRRFFFEGAGMWRHMASTETWFGSRMFNLLFCIYFGLSTQYPQLRPYCRI